ncbi:MAG: protein kinase [Cyanobacteria bacterium RU_5_0]|nr:protein kinase [Cyanobacteria bacterium RU_5_0]
MSSISSAQPNPWIGRTIGDRDRYRLDQRLSEGGMGDVFLATDTRIGKPVALKLLKESLVSSGDINFVDRFERECTICAALKSEHIVQVSDYGIVSEGYPFYVMEYLQGQTLSQLLNGETWHRLPVDRTCNIITQVCAGLQLAHEGVMLWSEKTGAHERIKVVHRDLKPANIFLVPTALGELVKIIDFGIAKIRSLHHENTSVTDVFLGTCHYASPEQFESSNVDQRADIYSLGVILYEMLTGIDPFGFDFRHNQVGSASWLSAHAFKTPRSLRSQPGCEHISPDLEAVVMQCLSKSPDNRFPSVQALSQALQEACFPADYGIPASEGGVVQAIVPDNGVEEASETDLQAETWKQRPVWLNPLTWVLVGGGLIAALIGTGVFVSFQPPESAPISETTASVEPPVDTPGLNLYQTLPGTSGPVWSVLLSFDGQTLVSGGDDNTLKIWNLDTGKVTDILEGHSDNVRSIDISQDGQTLVSGSGDKTVKVWNLQTGEVLHDLTGHRGAVWSVSLSRDGQTLISGSDYGAIRVWNPQTGQLVRTIPGHEEAVYSVALSPDGETFASSGADKTIKIWNLQTGDLIRTLQGHTDAVRAIAYSPNGQTIASASWDKTVRVWNAATGEQMHNLEGHTDRVVAIAISADGQTIVSASVDQTLRVWDAQAGSLLNELPGHTDWVLSVATSHSDQMIVSGGKDETIRIWR